MSISIGQWFYSLVIKSLNSSWHFFILKDLMAQLTKLTFSPWVNLSCCCYCSVVKSSATKTQNRLVVEVLYRHWALNVIICIMAGLSFIKVLATSPPWIQDTLLSKSHWMKVSAANLYKNNSGTYLKNAWLLVSWGLFLMPGSSPAPDLTLIC